MGRGDYSAATDKRAFLVLDGDRIAGIVTLKDIRRNDRSELVTVNVADIMTPRDHLEVITSRDDAADALNKMMQRDVRQLPVVQEGRLVGLLCRRDIVRWMQLQSEAGELR